MLKIACYGVRKNEVPFFNNLNTFNYDLTLIEGLLTHDNIDTAKGHDAVLLRGNCVTDKQNINKFREFGIKYIFTRTVGTDHIDVEYCKSLGIPVARVPGYSPNSIAELSFTLAMMLLRNTAYTVDRTSKQLMSVTPQMFSREVRNCTVGIIGTGRIGITEANYFKSMGAKVVGYDIYQSDDAKKILDFVTLDELLAQSDIVSLHIPYIKGQNDNMINDEFISKMKHDAILINTSRGEIQDNDAIVRAIKNNQLAGFGTDVLPNEGNVFFKDFNAWKTIPDDSVVRLLNLYPRVLITPHVGSNTDEALKNMIEISFANFNEIIKTGKTVNLV